MKNKYLIFTIYLFCCLYSFSATNKELSNSMIVPNIEIDRVLVEAICNDPNSFTYNFEIDLCGIHAPNGIPPATIHPYIRPNSDNTWIYLGAANLINSNAFIYEASITTNTPFNVETSIMYALYDYDDPANIEPWFGYDFCAGHRLFDMPAPEGDCEGCTPEEVTITANGTHNITKTLTYTVICGQNSVNINASNIENAVYNTSDPVLNDLNGLFAFGPGIESFVVDITGLDSCGDPYAEQVTILIAQDCPEIECCEGEDNILENGDFNQATCGGNNAFNNGCVPNWTQTDGSPNINGFPGNSSAGMWSQNGQGEAIATGFDFKQGETYKICFRIKALDGGTFDPNIINNATINFVATNNAGAVTANPSGDLIFQETMGPYLNVWTNVSLEFTPTANFSQLWIFPFMAAPPSGGSQAQLLVDDISICCPEKEISIVPFWAHPDCPEVVCEAQKWPIHVIDENGNPVTSAGGVIIEWTNEDTGEVFYQDFVYAHPQENWTVKVTYPNRCEYTATYFEDCCDDEVFIEAIICPTEANLQDFEQQLTLQRSTMTEATYREQLEALEILRRQAGTRDCDPCDIGWVMIRLVDAAGNEIDPANYNTITWSDGGNGTMRLIPVNFAITVTLTQINKYYECTYTDTFIYDCKEDCRATAPTNVQVNGTTLSWDPVPGATGYIVEPAIAWPLGCSCQAPISLLPIQTTGASVVLPIGGITCAAVQVRTICGDGTKSPPSDVVCVNGEVYVKDERLRQTSVSPNPTNGELNFIIEANEASEVTIEIRNIYGKMVYSTITNVNSDSKKSLTWDGTSKLTSGMYFITFKTANETIIKKVFVK
jgi:hypothetical protein